MPCDELLIIGLLQLIGSGLADVVRGDANVDSNTLMDIVIVVVSLLLLECTYNWQDRSQACIFSVFFPYGAECSLGSE